MIRSRFNWVILLIISGLLGISWIAYSQEDVVPEGKVGDLSEAPIAGYLAPDFTLSSTMGETITLSDYQGKPVVLNFWASWCPPCRVEMPHFQEVSVKYRGQAVVLGVDQGEPLPVVDDFGAAMGITYPLLVDADNSVNQQYAVVALPTTVFIDKNGIIQEVYPGIVNRAILEDRIEKLLVEG